MSTILSSNLKRVMVSALILSAAIGTTFAINPAFVVVPQQSDTHQLYDALGDVSDSNIDIIEFGSSFEDHEVIIYLIVGGIIDENAEYQIFIVAKQATIEETHIYFLDIDMKTETETNYGSMVLITNETLRVHFSMDNLIPGSFMIGIEARALNFDEEDVTLSVRNNVLATKFLGIF